MKKGLMGVLLLALFIWLAALPGNDAKAYEFSICHHCDGTGLYHCNQCNDRGEVYCEICAGLGYWECPYCDGMGYEICPKCNGDTYSRTPDGEIGIGTEPGTCGCCNGTGKLPCGTCNETGRYYCYRCGGAGYAQCQTQCRYRDKNDKLCSYCKGTGYLGDGFDWKDEWNDGKTNVPKEGNTIWRSDRSSYRYHKNPTASETAKIANELSAYKTKALTNLEKVLNKYDESLYSAKQYKKLKSTYNKGVKAVNNAENIGGVDTAYYKYKAALLDIRPSVLDKYKEKCKKKIRKAYADIEKKYCVEEGFWDRKLGQVMGDGIDALVEAKTKSKVKKIMKNTLAKLVY